MNVVYVVKQGYFIRKVFSTILAFAKMPFAMLLFMNIQAGFRRKILEAHLTTVNKSWI